MKSTFQKVLLLLAAFFLVAFSVVLVNQTAQLVGLAEGLHPVAGDATLWGLVFIYALCGLVPVFFFLRLPKPLVPPPTEDGPEFDEHLDRLRERLRRNALVAELPLDSREDVEGALAVLDARADEVIRTSGSQIFLTTAISQNGALDSLLVLAMQSRMVWEIGRLYYQRPTFRDMLYLYSNVVTTAFVAGELDEVDLSAQIQPVLSSVMGSAAGAVPGLQVVSAVIVNSVFSGTTNAFLSLRVGLIAKGYSRALVRPEKGGLRRTAIAGATAMLGGIAMEGARRVSRAMVRASARSMGDVVKGVGGKVVGTGTSMVDWMKFWEQAAGEDPEPEGA